MSRIDIDIMDAINEDDCHPGCGQIGHGGIVEFNRSYGLEDHPFALIGLDSPSSITVALYGSEDDYQRGHTMALESIPLGEDAVAVASAAIAALLDAGQPCDKCGVYVPTGDHCGNDRADGTSEYLCPDCYTPEGE